MGPSGSGKTSLLNVLAQRVPNKDVSGSVFVDGSPLSKSFKRRMGFVFQVVKRTPPRPFFLRQSEMLGVCLSAQTVLQVWKFDGEMTTDL